MPSAHSGHPKKIGPVGVPELADAHRSAQWDAGSLALLKAETGAIAAWVDREGVRHESPDLEHPRARPGTLMGLALSGGGIRSATFALGVLQLLARRDLLGRFDYLSTVSGGGYIGSALTWWLNGGQGKSVPPPGLGPADFPFGTDDPANAGPGLDREPQRALLRYLRQHGNYLTPGKGLNLLSAAATALRGVFLSALFWVLALTVAIAWLWLAPDWFSDMQGGNPFESLRDWLWLHLPWLGVSRLLETLLGIPGGIPPLFELALWLAVLLFAGLLAGSLVYSFLSFFRWKPAIAYRFRRWNETVPGPLYALIALCAVVGATAVIGEIVSGRAAVLGSGSLLAGLGAGLWAFLRSGSWKSGPVPLPMVVSAGALLLLFGALVVSYVLAGMLVGLGSWYLAALTGAAFFYAYIVNLNFVSIHRFYRDRLMEAFLPDGSRIAADRSLPAQEANEAKLGGFWDASHPRGPYHLINTNVVLAGSGDRTRRLRGGDNFILSPLYCGSNATGWRATEEFIGGFMKLSTAMAISGAAANPNAGPGGAGIMRNRILSLLMTVLGASLGYWVPHPLKAQWLRPNRLWPGLSSLLPGGFHEGASFLELSDGGHFENLAVYELIRRRVRLILLCDGAQDPAFAYEDLQVLIRRIEADFGAQLFFDEDNRLEVLMPRREAGYPPGARIAERGHIVGTVHYCDGTRGLLVYLKTTMIDRLSLKTKGYKGAHPDFPDQTTADQFFDEDQFEAYRELGYRLAGRMVDEVEHTLAGQRATGLGELMRGVESGRLHPAP